MKVHDLSIQIADYQQRCLRNLPPPRPPVNNMRAKIECMYDDVHRLSDEKVILAARIQQLLFRTCARLDGELLKVRRLTGEAVEPPGPATRSAHYSSMSVLEGMLGAAAAAEEPAVPVSAPVVARRGAPRKRGESRDGTPDAGQPLPKRRRQQSVASSPTQIRLDSPAPPPPAPPASAHHPRSRLSHQVEPDAEDEDAEGEEEEDEDERPYCFCHSKSHGDMIGCDNEDCPYQWFHLSCVNLKPPLPDQWFCPECAPKMKKRKR